VRRALIVTTLTAVVGVFTLGAAVASARPAGIAQATVPIFVFHSKKGGTEAFAKVIIHGHAFPFLIDTGASTTLVNPTLAHRLHLKTVGRPHTFCGVTSCATARRVRLKRWSISGVPLPSAVVSSAPIVGTGGFGFGLLGSDVLSRFGSVTINYSGKTLTLG
jgi:predicted aspartyl protease